MSPAAGHQTSPPDQPPDDCNDAPNGRGASSFEWEFSSEPKRFGSNPSVPLAAKATDAAAYAKPLTSSQRPAAHPQRGDAQHATAGGNHSNPRDRDMGKSSTHAPEERFGRARANYVRHQIDVALDVWWSASILPPPALLQDGLLLLEAGGDLNESQLTLLLRAALAHGRGVHTALKHQSDAERVGLIIAECLVDWNPPLRVHDEVVRSATGNPAVMAALIVDLRRRIRESSAIGSSRAAAVLGQLTQPSEFATVVDTPKRQRELRRPLRQAMFVALLLVMFAFIFFQRRAANPAEMVLVPGGIYTSPQTQPGDQRIVVEVESVFVDRFEVTNRNYRDCIAQGACPWPTSTDSVTQVAYFTNPALADFPVINVTLDAAQAYCLWQRKRLPTADEWTAAGGGAPATRQLHRFPWGEQFDPQRANSVETTRSDTVPVGAFRPAGNSPIGAADMAGNVAEWTSTQQAKGGMIIKGGSFADDRVALQVTSEQVHAANESAPWLGFRCARSARSTR